MEHPFLAWIFIFYTFSTLEIILIFYLFSFVYLKKIVKRYENKARYARIYEIRVTQLFQEKLEDK